MVIALIGESCTGEIHPCRHVKREAGSFGVFRERLSSPCKRRGGRPAGILHALAAHMEPDAEPFIYVISEKEHLAFLPAGALRILVTAELPVIQERFARRTGGKLPPPLAAMLEKKHGMFDAEPHNLLIKSGEMSMDAACAAIMERIA